MEFLLDINYFSMGFLWDFKRISMELLFDSCGFSFGFPDLFLDIYDFYGYSLEILWDFKEIFMVFLLDVLGISMIFL